MLPINYLQKDSSDLDKIYLHDSKHALNYSDLEKLIYAISLNIISKIDNYSELQRSVVIMLDRDVNYIASMFAAWKIGSYFIPINNNWPEIRKLEIIDHCNADVVICHKESFYQKSNAIFIEDIFDYDNHSIIKRESKPSDLAYIIYTSGTTGDPKGVMIKNESYVSYIEWTKRYFKNYSKNESLLITAELTFDITMGDIAFALAFGTTVYIAPDPKNILFHLKMINEYKIDTFYSVPTTHLALFNFVKAKNNLNIDSLKLIISGGDVFTIDLIKTINDVSKNAHFYNVYGPTEMTINCFAYRVDNLLDLIESENRIPIGEPFDIIDAVIINDKGEDVTNNNEIGVLYTAGIQTMLGYLGDQEGTKSSFINDPRYTKFFRSLYCTGDLAIKKDGLFYLFGRADDLIKIKGYRIHPNELSAGLSKIKFIKDAVTIVTDTNPKTLLSFVTLHTQISESDIINELKNIIPSYMLPEKIIILEEFPLNNSGKIDRNKLINDLKNRNDY